MNDIRKFRISSVLPPRGVAKITVPTGFDFIDLEIGSGVGWHAIKYARENPSRFLIAIEKTSAKFARFESRLAGHVPIPNLFPVHADAVAWVAHCIGEVKISRCLILYPNPNLRVTSQRWIRMPFMHYLIEVMKSGGELVLATNEEDYAKEVEKYGQEAWGLKLDLNLSFTHETAPKNYPRTHFEKKYLARGETCYELRFRKP